MMPLVFVKVSYFVRFRAHLTIILCEPDLTHLIFFESFSTKVVSCFFAASCVLCAVHVTTTPLFVAVHSALFTWF